MATAYKRTEDIHFAEVGKEFYVVLEHKDVLACVNPPAFAVLENMDGFTEPADFGRALAKRLDRKGDEVARIVTAICKEFGDIGLLEQVERKGKAKQGPFNMDYLSETKELPEIVRVWGAAELAGGIFVNTAKDGDPHVIVPNVTDGPIKTCPAHTCTIPAGLFTADTIIRTFGQDWRKNFAGFRRSGFAQFKTTTKIRG